MKFLVRGYMEIAQEYKEGYGVNPTAEQLLDGCLLEEFEFDQNVNSSGYWITPNTLYIDWDIMKNHNFGSKKTYNLKILECIQSRLKVRFRESKINKVLS